MGQSKFTPEIVEAVLKRLETEPLRQICRTEGFPAASTVLDWVNEDPIFGERYARARGLMLENMAEELLEISDDGTNDYMKREIAEGVFIPIVDQEHIQRSKLRVDSRKWLLSKLRPDKYGDRNIHEHSGPGGSAIPVIISSVLDEKS